MINAFVAAFDRAPEGIWAAPGRINLIGEHTDYNDGFVLPFALAQRVTVAAARRSDRLLSLRSLQMPDQPGSVSLDSLRSLQMPDQAASVSLDRLRPLSGWAAYPAGVAWALMDAGLAVGGVDLLVDGDVPLGGGLSSSAALECAVAGALNGLFALGLDAGALAALCTRAENEFVGMPCGVMDQLAAVHGRVGHAVFIDTRTLSVAYVPLGLDAAGLCILVIDTGAAHALVGGEYATRRKECETAAACLGVPALRDVGVPQLAALDDERLRRRARHVVTENGRVLDAVDALRRGSAGDVGRLLTASHASLRDDFEVSTPRLDTAVDACLAAGALGARLTGGGFGGCAIALVPVAEVEPVRSAVAAAFAKAGWPPPRSFVAAPSDGARHLA
jgi:galactokinase